MERCHLTRKRSSSPRRPRARMCLRKGCGRRYQPRRWNQRYCQDPECMQQVRRWQAAQRQARRRQDDAVKAEHAAAQRVRRQRARLSSQAAAKPEVVAARGHAAKIFCRSLLRAAGVLRVRPEVGPQSGTLLWPCLPPGGSQGAGSRAQMDLSRHFASQPVRAGRPRTSAGTTSRHNQPHAATGTAAMSRRDQGHGRAGPPSMAAPVKLSSLGQSVRYCLLP